MPQAANIYPVTEIHRNFLRMVHAQSLADMARSIERMLKRQTGVDYRITIRDPKDDAAGVMG